MPHEFNRNTATSTPTNPLANMFVHILIFCMSPKCCCMVCMTLTAAQFGIIHLPAYGNILKNKPHMCSILYWYAIWNCMSLTISQLIPKWNLAFLAYLLLRLVLKCVVYSNVLHCLIIKPVLLAQTGVQPSGFVKKYKLYISYQAQLLRISISYL